MLLLKERLVPFIPQCLRAAVVKPGAGAAEPQPHSTHRAETHSPALTCAIRRMRHTFGRRKQVKARVIVVLHLSGVGNVIQSGDLHL